MSVRNSSGGLVQFYYGDDGLDPAFLEADILPVDFKRNLQHIMVRSQRSYSHLYFMKL